MNDKNWNYIHILAQKMSVLFEKERPTVVEKNKKSELATIIAEGFEDLHFIDNIKDSGDYDKFLCGKDSVIANNQSPVYKKMLCFYYTALGKRSVQNTSAKKEFDTLPIEIKKTVAIISNGYKEKKDVKQKLNEIWDFFTSQIGKERPFAEPSAWVRGKDITPYTILAERSLENYGFRGDVYIEREAVDDVLAKKLSHSKHCLLVAKPLAGKSRAILQRRAYQRLY